MPLCTEMCLFANCSSSNAYIMVLPNLVLLCASFLSPLLRRSQFVVRALWFWCETLVSSRGASYTILFLDCYPKCLKLLQMKHSDTPRSSDASTNLIDNWGTRLSDRMFHIFRNGWIGSKDAILCL